MVHAHSGLRWLVLALLVYAIINALMGKNKGTYEKKDKMINLFTMVSLHIQLLLGLVLYFTSGKVNFSGNWMANSAFRFFNMEHLVMMLLAITLVTLGRKKAENAAEPVAKHKKIVLFYSVALVLIFLAIPWPFRAALGVDTWF